MQEFDWKKKYENKVKSAPAAMKLIKPGNRIFIGTGCAQPQHLVNTLVEHSTEIYDTHIVHLLTMGTAPYANEKFREIFKVNSFFIADNVRDAMEKGIGDYTPIFLSDIPAEFASPPACCSQRDAHRSFSGCGRRSNGARSKNCTWRW